MLNFERNPFLDPKVFPTKDFEFLQNLGRKNKIDQNDPNLPFSWFVICSQFKPFFLIPICPLVGSHIFSQNCSSEFDKV